MLVRSHLHCMLTSFRSRVERTHRCEQTCRENKAFLAQIVNENLDHCLIFVDALMSLIRQPRTKSRRALTWSVFGVYLFLLLLT